MVEVQDLEMRGWQPCTGQDLPGLAPSRQQSGEEKIAIFLAKGRKKSKVPELDGWKRGGKGFQGGRPAADGFGACLFVSVASTSVDLLFLHGLCLGEPTREGENDVDWKRESEKESHCILRSERSELRS